MSTPLLMTPLYCFPLLRVNLSFLNFSVITGNEGIVQGNHSFSIEVTVNSKSMVTLSGKEMMEAIH